MIMLKDLITSCYFDFGQNLVIVMDYGSKYGIDYSYGYGLDMGYGLWVMVMGYGYGLWFMVYGL